jgi:hypothetical protein
MPEKITARQEQKEAHRNARASDELASNLSGHGWPLDAQGDPMAEIAFQAHELIGLENFSNITVGPAIIRTLVSINKPNPFSQVQLKNIASAINQIAQIVEEDIVAEQRVIALNTLDPGKQPG